MPCARQVRDSRTTRLLTRAVPVHPRALPYCSAAVLPLPDATCQVWDHLGAAPDPSERTVLERQLRLLPELLAHLLTVVPHGLCSFVLRELGNPMAPEEAEPPAPADGVGARPGLEAVRPPPLPDPARRLLEMYDSYARLVLYDMGCAVGALVTCRVLLGGGGDGGGGDAGGESSGASCFSEEALAQLWDYGHALVAATSTSFRAFVSRELLRLRDGGGLGRTPEEQHAGAFVAGRAAAEGGACSAGGMQQRPRAAGPPEAISGMARGGGRSGSGRRGSGGGGGGGGGSGSDDEGTGWGDDGPMSEWFALDSVWGVQPGGEANLVTALLMARMAPSIGSGFARLRLRGPEAAVLLMLCIKETEKVGLVANEAERYMLLPSLATQGEECDQFNCRVHEWPCGVAAFRCAACLLPGDVRRCRHGACLLAAVAARLPAFSLYGCCPPCLAPRSAQWA